MPLRLKDVQVDHHTLVPEPPVASNSATGVKRPVLLPVSRQMAAPNSRYEGRPSLASPTCTSVTGQRSPRRRARSTESRQWFPTSDHDLQLELLR